MNDIKLVKNRKNRLITMIAYGIVVVHDATSASNAEVTR